MPKSRIPSPARSQGAPVTPRRQKPRTRSVGSPARSNASGRLSTVIDQFKEINKTSFALSPLGKTVLNDDTDIEQPRRASWWKRVDHSRVVSEVLDTDEGAVNNVFDELDIEVLSQEKKDYTMDLPESSDSESISSIVIPQRKLFSQKENLQQNRYREIVKTRESLTKQNRTNNADKTASETGPRNLFNKAPKRTKPIFPAALLNFSPDKTANKTKELPAEVIGEARNLFGNRPGTKRKNMFADFILSESEDDISEIQPKLFAFQKNSAPVRHSTARPRETSPTSSITTDIEMDDWHLLPSSTLVEQQIEAVVGTTPGKRTRLSKLSETKESTVANSTANKTKHSNKSVTKNDGNNDLNEIAKTNMSLKPKAQVDVVTGDHEKQHDNIKTSEKNLDKSNAINKYVEETPEATQEENQDNDNSKQIQSIHDKSKKNNQELDQDGMDAEVYEEMEVSDHEEGNNKAAKISENEIEPNQKQLNENYEYEKKIETGEHIVDKRMEDNKPEIDEQEMAEQTIMDQEIGNGNQELDLEIEDDKQEIPEQAFDDPETNDDEEEADKQETEVSEQKIEDEVDEEELVLQMEDEDEIENDDNEFEQEVADNEEQNESQEVNDENQEKENNSQEIHDQSASNGVAVENDEEGVKIESDNENEIQNESENIENDRQEIDDDEVENDYDEREDSDEEQDGSQEVLNDSQEQHIKNTSQEIQEQSDEENYSDIQNESAELEEENDEEIQNQSQANINNESQEIDDDQVENDYDEQEAEEREGSGEEQDESQELLNESQEQDIENTSQEIQEQSDEENDSDIRNESAEVEDQNDEENQDQSQAEINNESQEIYDDQEQIQNESQVVSDGDQEDNEQEDQESNEHDYQEENEQDDQEAGDQETEPQETESATPNISHDTTGRNRKKDLKSPEAILHEVTNQTNSFTTKGRNTSIRKTKSIFKTNHSLAPVTESTRLSDGTKNSSAEGSGWDSHRTTRKTLRQTFGRDFTPRKSLRALVMEKSAKRQTAINEANAALNLQEAANDIPPEDPQDPEEMDYDDNIDNVENIEESDHEVSKRTRQTTLEMYLQKIKKENIERKLKIEEQVKNSLKFNPHRRDFLNRIPPKPIRRTAKPLQIAPKKRLKPSVISLEDLPPELAEDMKYKPPKRYQPSNASWITKRLYKFLETKLEPIYDYKARVRAEKLVEMIYNFARDTRRDRVAAPHAVAELKREMARLHIVRTHFDFYNFFHDYMPLEVKIKVVPDIVNDIPLPRNGVFGDIMDAQ